MATRPFIAPFQVVTNGSMGASITSLITNIQQISYVGYTVSWTGAPVGSISVQVCNDYDTNPDGSVRSAGTWVPIALSTPISPSGTADSAFIDIVGISSAWIRLVYTRTSGTGVLNAVVDGKVS